jgi:hypothetical protein
MTSAVATLVVRSTRTSFIVGAVIFALVNLIRPLVVALVSHPFPVITLAFFIAAVCRCQNASFSNNQYSRLLKFVSFFVIFDSLVGAIVFAVTLDLTRALVIALVSDLIFLVVFVVTFVVAFIGAFVKRLNVLTCALTIMGVIIVTTTLAITHSLAQALTNVGAFGLLLVAAFVALCLSMIISDDEIFHREHRDLPGNRDPQFLVLRPTPPFHAERLILWLASSTWREAAQGDFLEIYERNFKRTFVKHGRLLAHLSYWCQVLRSAPGLMQIRLRHLLTG